MMFIALALGIVLIVALFVLAARDSRLLPPSLLLLVSLLSLQAFLRFGMSYDLVRGPVRLPSFDGAPVASAVGVVVLIAGAVCAITLLWAIGLLARTLLKARPSALLMSGVLAPALLLLGVQYFIALASDRASHGAGMDEATLTDAGARWAAQHNIRADWACAASLPGHREDGFIDHPAFIDGCTRTAQGRLRPKQACNGYYIVTQTTKNGRLEETRRCVQ